MKNLKITMVKFYQGVNIDQQSNMNSAKVISERSVQEKKLVKIEKSDIGVLITTEDVNGRVGYTEVPFNNLAYINYEAGQAEAEQTAKSKAK